MTFSQRPATCLDHVKDTWPRDGILRVEILQAKKNLPFHDSPSNLVENSSLNIYEYYENNSCGSLFSSKAFVDFMQGNKCIVGQEFLRSFNKSSDYFSTLNGDYSETNKNSYWNDENSVEYALEYGLLRLTASARKKHKIPVQVVKLDPYTDKCFGDSFSRFILQEFLGYDDLLMASVKILAEQEDNKGYLR